MKTISTPAQYKNNLRNVYGTFAIEGISISESTKHNLERLDSGQANYKQIVDELRTKYSKKG